MITWVNVRRGHTFSISKYRFHWQILMQKSCLLWRLARAAMSAQDYAKTWIRAALSGLKYVSEDNDVNSHSGGEIIHYPHPLVRITLEILWRLFWAQTMRPCALPVICRCVPITNNQSKVALWSQILGRVVGRVVGFKTKVHKDFIITKKALTIITDWRL